MVYNTCLIPPLEDRHPSALGRSYREAFSEQWPSMERNAERYLYRGETVVHKDLHLPLKLEDGRTETRYHTFTVLPVYDDECIVSLVITYQDTTEAVVGAQLLERNTARDEDHPRRYYRWHGMGRPRLEDHVLGSRRAADASARSQHGNVDRHPPVHSARMQFGIRWVTLSYFTRLRSYCAAE